MNKYLTILTCTFLLISCKGEKNIIYEYKPVYNDLDFANAFELRKKLVIDSITAWAQGMEAEIGSLRPGHQADWVVLDQDLLRAPLEAVGKARVRQTGIAGKVVFSA